MSIPIHRFINLVDHNQYQRSIRIHLLENTVDINGQCQYLCKLADKKEQKPTRTRISQKMLKIQKTNHNEKFSKMHRIQRLKDIPALSGKLDARTKKFWIYLYCRSKLSIP